MANTNRKNMDFSVLQEAVSFLADLIDIGDAVKAAGGYIAIKKILKIARKIFKPKKLSLAF